MAATKYMIDAEHAHVSASAEHFGVARMYIGFGDVSGSIMFDSENKEQSSVEFVVKTASLLSDFEGRTEALISPFFLSIEKYPEIRFASTGIKETGENVYTISGNLTIRDVTKEVSFSATVKGPIADPWGNPRIGIMGQLMVNRQDYGITFDRKLKSGDPLVGDEVEIQISVEAIPAQEE
jgi:polyisoprenoid-binding protein YceI